MKIYNDAYLLLEKKLQLFMEITQITDTMITLDADGLFDAVNQREQILAQIQAIDNNINNLSLENSLLLDSINNTCSKDSLSSILQDIYDISFKIKGLITKLVRNEESIRVYIENEKQEILDKIQNLNQSSNSVASKYSQGVQTSQQNIANSKKNRFI